MNVIVLGSGAWGQAIASVISQNTSSVNMWKRGEEIPDADIYVIAVPTSAIRQVLKQKKSFVDSIIVNCSKGIEKETFLLPHQIVQEVCKDNIKYFSLMGPSFSREVMDKMPTLVNLGSSTNSDNQKVQQVFQTDYFRVRITSGIAAIELAAALKNLYALACGIAEGLEFGENTRAKLIAISIEETYRLCEALSFKIDDHATASMIGDFLLTCSSVESRNFKFGKLLVEKGVEGSLKEINATVEGYNTVFSIPYFTKKSAISLPLAEFIQDAVKLSEKEKIRERFFQFTKQV